VNSTKNEIQNYDILTYIQDIWANAKGKKELGSKKIIPKVTCVLLRNRRSEI